MKTRLQRTAAVNSCILYGLVTSDTDLLIKRLSYMPLNTDLLVNGVPTGIKSYDAEKALASLRYNKNATSINEIILTENFKVQVRYTYLSADGKERTSYEDFDLVEAEAFCEIEYI